MRWALRTAQILPLARALRIAVSVNEQHTGNVSQQTAVVTPGPSVFSGLGVDKSLRWEFSSMALQPVEMNYADSEELESYIHNKFNFMVKHHY